MRHRQQNVSQSISKPPNQELKKSWKSRYVLFHISSNDHYNMIVSIATLIIILCAVMESISSTAYGKFGNDAVFAVSPRFGWWLMELPVSITFVYFFYFRGGSQSHEFVPRLLAGIMVIHYSYRGWIFPYLIKTTSSSKNFSLVPALGGSLVTIMHGYLSAKWFAEHGKHLNKKWLSDIRFRAGFVLYFSGLIFLIWHDAIVRNLRTEHGPRYQIPRGGLFEYVTCAQYFVELWTWFGFFLLSWGPNGLFILLVSVANLIPRAAQTTLWYREMFGEEYPNDRKHIIPFVY